MYYLVNTIDSGHGNHIINMYLIFPQIRYTRGIFSNQNKRDIGDIYDF